MGKISARARTDLLLLHAPSVYDFRERAILYGPVSDMVPSSTVFEMYPLGFLTIASYLHDRGMQVRIVNLALRMMNSKRFDVEGPPRTSGREWSPDTWSPYSAAEDTPTSGAWLVMPIFPTSRTIKKCSLRGRSNGYSTVSFPSRYRRPQGRAPPPRPDRIPRRPSHAARCRQRRRSDPAWGQLKHRKPSASLCGSWRKRTQGTMNCSPRHAN